MKSATLILLTLAVSISSWSVTNVPKNAVPSSKHYRESGVGNATGRSGSATMVARALLSQDGSTTVEVSTGILDSTSTAPGSLNKVQYKPLSANGSPFFAQNFFPSTAGGYYSFISSSLHRAQQIQLQANITGIDRNRTDVVTVVETVKLRPDLAIEKLDFPGSAFVNQPVNISANVVEMNSDAGASTTCMLAIDGNNVDQVNNVYVDAGGSVSCAFVYTFPSIGNHTIAVTASNVVPADWDTSNNSSSGTINITNPITAEHAYATFSDDNGGFPLIRTSTYQEWNLGNLIEDNSQTFGTSGHEQDSYVTFSSSGCAGSTNAVPWQFPVNVTYTETMDGQPVYSYTDAISGSSTSSTGFIDRRCGGIAVSETAEIGSNNLDDHWNYLYSSQYYDSAANVLEFSQTIEIERYAGDVTYWSTGYQCYYWNSPSGVCDSPSDYYSWNSSSQSQYGTLVPVGTSWVPSVATLDAAGNTFSGSISVPLSTTQKTNIQPNTCITYGPDSGGYAYKYCSSYNYNYTLATGSASN